ncbi:hypothetical protein COCMIDRAFT_105947 [Bipolaris oryzae ATCC 44560]|uniref:Uncharacterized protein n=1 Tax=Bipolaris oryzae ATCC 44560 TaxID=930090 RepID=W6YVE2_COCMI|nr:uncharacterized protein COCMIDRAFT_105947 [Bipolaris oryzae ATCC 44560]EUC41508.1 hypothetical protein COCMIDRAFT_105947 [Bipolaris oryzae ATCC 44560]
MLLVRRHRLCLTTLARVRFQTVLKPTSLQIKSSSRASPSITKTTLELCSAHSGPTMINAGSPTSSV